MGHWLGDHRAAIQTLYFPHGTQITSILFSPRAFEILQVKMLCQNYHRCPRKVEGKAEGVGWARNQWKEGHTPLSPFGGMGSDPCPLLLEPSKPSKTFQASDHCRGYPQKSWKKSVSLAPAAPETRQAGYPKSRNKHFIPTLETNQKSTIFNK